MTHTAGILHTVPALAPVFHELVGRGTGIDIIHTVDPRMLDTAIREGVTPRVQEWVAGHIADLVARGADAVLVTCSSIGEAVEAAAAGIAVPVIRVDEAMAQEAVALAAQSGGRIAVLATLEATLGPTGRLVERARGDAAVTVTARVVEGAAAARAAGDVDRHDSLVAAAIDGADADVIVLAQASMAKAAERATSTVPVLSSPESGAAALVATLS